MKQSKMNRDEETAYRFLCSHYGTNVVWQPDGQTPPDFLVDGQYAVEVRRLNQSFFHQDDPVGLEKLWYAIWSAVEQVCKSFDKEYRNATYGVDIRYRRPIDDIHKVKKKISRALGDYLKTQAGEQWSFPPPDTLSENFRLSVSPLSPIAGCVFIMSSLLDLDRGGFVAPLYLDNLAYCIDEKSSKIAERRSCYPYWWLLLVDYLGWGLDSSAVKLLTRKVTDLGGFDRVVLIDRSGQRILVEFAR